MAPGIWNFHLSSDPIIILHAILLIVWDIFKAWWWLPFPFIVYKPLKYLYLWYIQNDFWIKIKWIFLEIKVPKEIDRPLKAMEQVISNFWVMYDPPDFKEEWIEGKFLLTLSLEIVGVDGKVHFYIRIPENLRKVFESAVYSQYPEVEIEQVEDYTKNVPQDTPNKNWDMWACSFKMFKPDCYPIKTYADFFEPSQETKEEKRIDPLSVLAEGMSRLKPGEQLWLQLLLRPVSNNEVPWVSEGKAIVNKLVKRPSDAPGPGKSITGEAWRTLIYGPYPSFEETKKEQSLIPPEMMLTPGEKEIVRGIENKIGKNGFLSTMRMIYLGRNEVFFKANLRLILNFSVGLSTQNLNGLKPFQTTKIVPPSPFRDLRVYAKKRDIFKKYIRRLPPYYPNTSRSQGHVFILNAEEVATIFHFPGKVGAPSAGLGRIEAKKSAAPPDLPVG
ncbi:MAG: hypothetical protein M1127_00130 [Patescibacteria group bacterium]|nr:hypothetical protein [Patescibacteria group bacterium]